MQTTLPEAPAEFRRDDPGRPIAADGYPLSGLAAVEDLVLISGLSRPLLYARTSSGEMPSRKFGRARRVEWSVVRQLFLTTQIDQG